MSMIYRKLRKIWHLCRTVHNQIHLSWRNKTRKINIRHIYYYFLGKFTGDRFVFIKAFVKIKRGEYVHFNWGDELNANIIGYLTKRKAILLPVCEADKFFPIKSYMLIGSILTIFNLDRTTIWGTGIRLYKQNQSLIGKPEKVCAVRGPKTQQELIKYGIECPSVYGDPALLLPRFYQPFSTKQYSLGIVPHHTDMNDINVERLTRDKRIKLIKVQGYKKWTDFIDEICSCEFVVSASLHGLIVAEAYGIPSKWVKLRTYVDGWDFKFHDFFESIEKKSEKPFIINETTDYEQLISLKGEWKKGEIDLDKLIAACPINK